MISACIDSPPVTSAAGSVTRVHVHAPLTFCFTVLFCWLRTMLETMAPSRSKRIVIVSHGEIIDFSAVAMHTHALARTLDAPVTVTDGDVLVDVVSFASPSSPKKVPSAAATGAPAPRRTAPARVTVMV